VTPAHPEGVSGRGRRSAWDGEWPRVAPSGNRYLRFLLRRELTPARAGWAIASATAVVTVACGLVIRVVDPADFDTVGQGMWWAVQTVTTVGYGDIVPAHTGGRVIGAILMLSGIGFLTVVTAVVTAAFLETVRRRMGDPGHTEVLAKLDDLSERLQALESSLRR
jgi:voltage-gated potassium channel